MISTQLKSVLNEVISNEIYLSVIMLDLMSNAHTMGYNGFKRLFRYSSRDSTQTLSQQQIEKLKDGVKLAINDNENMLMEILEHYIKDEETELNKIKRIIKRWNNAKKYNDSSFLDREDKKIHKCIKKIEEKMGYKY